MDLKLLEIYNDRFVKTCVQKKKNGKMVSKLEKCLIIGLLVILFREQYTAISILTH